MRTIKLSQGLETIVDDEDFDELNKIKWCALKNGKTFYAVTTILTKNKKPTLLGIHTKIMGTPQGLEVDHLDGNGLNNTRINLRVCTHRQNTQNRHNAKTSQYVGISWDKILNKWLAHIRINGKVKHLGVRNTEIEAHELYLQALTNIGEMMLEKIY